MSARIGLARIVGTPTKSAWAQVHQFASSDETKITSRGQLYAVFSLDLTLLPSVDIGHEVITRLNEEYYGSGDEDHHQPFSLLRQAVETVASEFSETVKLEIATCVVWRKYVYFCIWGQAGVQAYRDQKLVNILSGQEQKLAIASGRLNPQDLFFLTTSAFDKLINPQTLVQMLSQYNGISELADNIIPLAHRASLPTLAAAILAPVTYTSEPETVGEEVAREEIASQQLPAAPVVAKNVSKGSLLKDLLVKIALKLPDQVTTTTRFTPNGRKTAVSVGLLLLALFALSIGFGIKQKQEQEHRLSYSTQLTQAQNAYGEALAKKDVDPEQSRELFLQAKQVADDLVNRGIKDKELSDLVVKIQNDTPNILGEVRQEATVFLDLSLVRTGVSASELALHQETLAILDKGGQRIISTSSSAKETLALSGPEKLKNPKSIAIYAGRYFSLGDSGIIELDKKGAVIREIKPDEEWVDPAKIGAYGSNIYLLDKGNPSASSGQVWRYSGIEGGFSAKQRLLGSGVTPDFSQVVDMAIDGSIWILKQDGTILTFTNGVPRLITPSGLEKPLSGPLAIYTDEELSNFYLLDKNNLRIVELSKRGVYQKQYLAPQIAETIDFVVSKKAGSSSNGAGKILLLTRDKVLELPL